MLSCKKVINAHLVQLALIVTLLRLDYDLDANYEWNSGPEVHDIFLGQSSAYIQTNFHNLHNELNRYIIPKNIDSLLDGLSLFSELNSLGRHSRFNDIRNDVVAYLASNHEQQQQDVQQSANSSSSGDINSGESDIRNQTEDSTVQSQQTFDENGVENSTQSGINIPCVSPDSELSPEDMGLIEILWKQDIDLGIGRDVFDTRESSEKEKIKICKTKGEKVHEDSLSKDKQTEHNENPSQSDPWKGLSYTVDLETGEHVFHQPCTNGTGNASAGENMFELDDDDLQHLAKELESLPLEEAFNFLDPEVYKDNETNCDKNEPLVSNAKDIESEITGDSANFDLSYGTENYEEESLFEELEKLEKMIQKSQEGVTKGEDKVNEMYPSVEDWHDFTANIPASILNGSSHSHFSSSQLSSIVRSSALYSQCSDGLTPISSNTQTVMEDSFPGVLLQNASLNPPVTDVGNHYTFATPNIGSSNIGSAVAASMAALTNDSDPMSDGMLGVTYSSEFPEFLYPPNVSGTVQGEYLLSQLLADEDLRLMDMNTSTEAGNCNAPTSSTDDHMDTSSDSAVSSMGPDRVPSISDCEWVDSCSESSSHHGDHEPHFTVGMNNSGALSSDINHGHHHQFSAHHHPVAQKKYKLFGKKTINSHEGNENDSIGFSDDNPGDHLVKNPQYLLLKGQQEENNPSNFYSMMDGATGLDARGHGYSSNDTPNMPPMDIYTDHLQHNHTYHLPFDSSSDNSQKPIVREKTKSLILKSIEDRVSRDEKKARSMKIPLTAEEIINLPIDEFNEKISKFDMSEHQITLIRDIRRRGKNKVAAQNCRKRKMDQIVGLQQDVDNLQLERDHLEAERNHMLFQRRLAQDKYAQLYQLVLQVTNPHPSGPPDFFPQIGQNRDRDTRMISNSTSFEAEPESETSKGTRAKRKMDKK